MYATVQIALGYGKGSPEFSPLFAKLPVVGKQKADLPGVTE